MPQSTKKPAARAPRVLGAKAFAAIAAVEGLRLSSASSRRLQVLKSAGLSTDERRAEVLKAYAGFGRKK